MSVSKLIAELSPEQRELLARQLREKKTKPTQATTIPRKGSSAGAPLSFHQERLWFLMQYEPDSPLYNLPAGVRLTGPLNRTALEQSFNEIIARHDAIRTSFATNNGQVMQVVNAADHVELPLTDLSALPREEQEREVQRLIEVEARAPFDLAHGPLVRMSLLRLEEEKHIALFTMHHIISDGWSIGVFTRELAALYEALAEGGHPSLAALPIQYGDFAAWQRDWLTGEVLESELSYWKQQLSGIAPMLQLPTDRPRPVTQTFNGSKTPFAFPARLSADLKTFCQQEQVTTFMLLVTGLQALLHRYTGQDDIVIGTPVAGRYPLETETLIGYFVNTLALRSTINDQMSFRQLLKSVREMSIEAFAHQNVPFEKLVDAVAPARDLSHTPLIQVWFVLHNTPMPALNLRGLELEPFEVDGGTAKFDLTLSMVQTAQGLRGSWVYNTDLFDAQTVARISEQFQLLLEGAVKDPDQTIASLPLLSHAERDRLMDNCHAATVERPQHQCLHQLFEAQVERTPEAVAIELENERLTYQELNQRANQLAHYLRALQIGPENLVGICMERSLDVVVGLLATLKAGGVYVPLDPQQPEERLAFMMQDAQAPVLLTQSWLLSELPAYAAMSEVVCLDSDWQAIAQESDANLTDEIAPENLAYIIYTSGSTGKPKGVCISHRAAVDHCLTMQQEFGLSPADRVLQFASFNFDVSLEQILPTLFSGATLVLRGKELWTVTAFQRQLQELNLTVANLPTAYWHQLAKEESVSTGQLRLMIVGGDLLLPEPAHLWQSHSPWTTLINAYGPTETVITASLFVVPQGFGDESVSGRVPIGRPLTNRSMFVLDQSMGLTPAGVPGELYIGGPLLARGYLNRPGLTAERFCPNPFSKTPGERLYRTGDIVRYLPDGNVEFLGRVDDQVKIRGYRIELGEVEAALVENPEVREAVVMPREDVPGEKRLVAYVVSEHGKSQKAGELRLFLKKKLPEYMVPSAFVMLSELPLTPNGKIDRAALPSPDESRPEVEASFVAPGTMVEEMLAQIWTDILGLERVGVNDDFFELGGHSLLATQIVSRVRETFGVEVHLRKLFESPTIASLAESIESELQAGPETTNTPIQKRARDGYLPLSFAQQRLWYLNQLERDSAVYNMLTMVEFEGQLNVPVLEQSLNEVVKRHEVLRTTFTIVGGEPQQVISPPGRTAPFSTRNLAQLTEEKQQELLAKFARDESARHFDLEKGPLLRALLVVLGERRHVLLLTMHHIVSDAWSLGVFVQEVAALYKAFANGEPSPLTELPIQYADYAVWEKELLQGEKLQNEYRYWEQQLASMPSELNLPLDHPRPATRFYRGRNITFTIPNTLAGLKALSRSEGATLFMTVLAAWQVLLARYSGQFDISVGTPVAGRNQSEVEQLIGFFVNTLVMRTDLSGDPSFREVLRRVREVSLSAYMHQQLPFEKLVEALQPERHANRNPLFQVMFIMQNTPVPNLEFEGLKLRPLEFHSGTAKFDLTLDLAETPEGLKGWLEYSSDLFEAATIERMVNNFRTLLEAIVAHPEESILKLPLLNAEEKQRLLVEWNQTEQTYSGPSCIHELFEAQVERSPEQTAVIYEQQRLSYRELNERANQLAHHLRGLGVGPESLVGVCLERSAQMMVALLGILKSGAAYLPLDPDYPQERLSYMLTDSQAGVLLTTRSLGDRFSELPLTVVSLDNEREQIAKCATSNVASGSMPANLAYVIYTSGSTGRPKGIMVTHESVVNFFTGMKQSIGDEERGTWLAVTSISFDISVLELLGSVARGFEVVVQPDPARTLNTASLRRKFASRKMDFSLFYFASDESEANEDKYQLLIEGAKFADQNGFDAVWTPERHFHKFGGLYPNPSITSAVVAAITERVKIRAGSVVLPLHTPIRVAEEWSVVDNVSKGRVGLSFASGWHANDFVLAPENFKQRKEIMMRDIETVRRLWRGEAVALNGPFGNEVNVKVLPRPVQSELPVWLTAAGNPETFRAAGEIGANLLTHLLGQSVEELSEKIEIYRESWRKAGHAGEGYVTLMLHTFVGHDLDEVREKVRQPFTGYLKSAVGLVQQMQQGMGYDASAQLTDADLDRVLAAAFKRYFGTSGLLGTPETCLEMVDRLKGVGIDEIGCLIDFGVDYDSVMASLKYLNEVRQRSNEPVTLDYSLPAQITRHGVTHLQCTPSMAKMLTLDAESRDSLRALKKLMLGGEELPAALVRELKEFVTGEMHNMYGPTETTIWSATHHIENVDGRVPIGRPIANTQIYILDSQAQPVPTGVTGELHISGAGLARGYLHRPDLTAERFLPDPFSAQPGARTYRTGDLARYLSDGEIEFLGRFDDQVKIRGFRIELGEVEAALAQHAGVQAAVVAARQNQNNETQLIAYVSVRRESPGLTSTELSRHLKQKLPEYMMPSVFVFLDEFPLTLNGKINRRALPDPEQTRPQIEAQYIAPRTQTEETVAQIWREVLGVEQIGVNDSFFELGGHSLLATRLIARINETVKVKLTLTDFFEALTVADVAAHIEKIRSTGDSADVSTIKPVPHREHPPLSFAQQRLWFLMQLEPNNPSLSVPAYIRIQGQLDIQVLERSFTEIARRHEALRTTFATVRGEPVQAIVPPQSVTLPLHDLRGLDPEKRAAEVQVLIKRESQRSFNLAEWPLFRAVLVRLGDEEHYLLLSMHHIISDAWSCEVFISEMSTLYEAFSNGQSSPLPELPIQYADFAIWQREQLQDERIEKHLSYWRKQLAGAPPVFSLPNDRPRPEVQSHRGANLFFRLPDTLAESLRTFSRQENVTLFMTLLASFQALLHSYTKQDDIVIAIDAANRNQLETEKLIGFFINQLVIRNEVSRGQTFRELLGSTREVTTEAYAHQDLPFEKLVDALSPERSLQHAPLCQLKLSFQKSEVARQLPAGLSFSPLEIDNGTAQLDLVLFLEERGERLIGCVNYSTDLFYPTTIERLLKDYEALLSAITEQPEVSLATLEDMLAEKQRERQAAEARQRIEANLAKLKAVRRTPARDHQEAAVEAGYLRPEQTLPRLIQPARYGVDLVAWTRNHLEYIETELLTHGAILFRDFGISSGSELERFALAINADLLKQNGEHQRQAISDSIYTPVSYPNDKKLLWHNENSFNHHWPMKIWFHCVQPAQSGGETPLVDSRKVFSLLNPEIKRRFMDKGVTYVRNYIDGLGLNWQSVFRTTVKEEVEEYCRKNFMDFEWKANGDLRTRCVRPAVWKHPRSGEMVWFNQAQHWHPACLDEQTRAALRALYTEEDMPRNCYYGDGSLIEDSVMNEICEVYGQLEVSFAWQAGDILLVDNLLTAHARNAYAGERRLFVTMGEMSSYAEAEASVLTKAMSS